MRSYWISFLLALGVHLFFFCSFNSLVERPENGLAKGLSSLEVVLVEAQQEKDNFSSPEIKKSLHDENPVASQKAKSLSKLAPQKQTGSSHQREQISSVSSGAIDVTPSYLHNPQPLYPEEERKSGHEGTVLLRVAINEQGAITHLAIEHSSGYPALDHQAANTVESSWVFRPAHRNGQAISSTVLIPIHFSLKN
jgi:TonB family protein